MGYGNWKPRRIVDRKAVEAARRDYCEHCGCYAGPGVSFEVHHVRSRGSGGDDVPENLINLCIGFRSNWCHDRAHRGRIGRDVLREIVAARQQQN